jgi:twitching motility protein PilU
MVKVGASDLFLSVGALPTAKVEGRMVALDTEPLQPGVVRTMAYSVMTESQIRLFESTLECDLAVSVGGLGRFRFNVFPQRGEVSAVVRLVKQELPTLASLQLPAVVAQLALLRQGLVLVVGSAGSGKSSTLAAMLEHPDVPAVLSRASWALGVLAVTDETQLHAARPPAAQRAPPPPRRAAPAQSAGSERNCV